MGLVHATSAGLTVSISLSANELPVLGGEMTFICNNTPRTPKGSAYLVGWECLGNIVSISRCDGSSCTVGTSSKYKLSSDGITGGNMTIMNLLPSDNGIYRCKVVNEYGIGWSNDLNLTTLARSEYIYANEVMILLITHKLQFQKL